MLLNDVAPRRLGDIAFGATGGLRRRARGFVLFCAAALVEGSRAVMRGANVAKAELRRSGTLCITRADYRNRLEVETL